MENFVLAWLARDWAGLALAAAPALCGALAVAAGRATHAAWLTVAGVVLLLLALAMAAGALVHLATMARVRRCFPPPGRMVDVRGTRVHVLAEGEPRGKPAIVWMAGGHAAGYALHHMHRTFRQEARSILVDRPGTGWSDPGPFPRTTRREADEVFAALAAAGETGPFVLVGHSFGGLLVACMARRRPDLVAALVLADATPPDTVIYGPRIPVLRLLRQDAVLKALPRLIGFHENRLERDLRRDGDAHTKKMLGLTERVLGEAWTTLQAVESGTKAACTGASIYRELSAPGLAAVAWDTVLYEGDLGEMPVFLVAPGTMGDEEFEATAAMIEAAAPAGAPPLDRERLRRFYLRSRERYLAVSANARRIRTPDGTGHNFPFEVPDFLADVVRQALAAAAAVPGSRP